MVKIIYGLTELAECLYYGLAEQHIKPDAFCADREYIYIEEKFGIKVLAFEDLRNNYPHEEIGIWLGIGYNGMNKARKNIYEMIKEETDYSILSFKHDTALVQTDDVGEGNLFFEYVNIGPFSKIGNANVFYPNVFFAHHSTMGDYNFMCPVSAVAGLVHVGDNCFFGMHSTVKDNVNVADYTLVGAMAYLTRNTKPYDTFYPAQRGVRVKGFKSTELIECVRQG